MRRIKIVGLCLVAVFAMGAAATSAMATPPEYGQCIKTVGGTYKDGGCKVVGKTVEEKKYEWHPWADGTIKTKTFKTHIKEIKAGAATLEGLTGIKVQCSNQTSTGEFTGPKAVKVENIVFKGCLVEGTGECTNAGPGEIKVKDLEGEIDVYKFGETALKNKLGNALWPKGSGKESKAEFVTFFCGGLKTTVRGALISPITANAMKSTSTVKFTAKGGHQKPETFETSKGVKGPKLILETEFLGSKSFEQSGQTLTTVQENDNKEKIEARTF